jgi:DNA (cytosine-5)-methyltransferase 1
MRIDWHCERDTYCRNVLARHWPITPCFQDIHDLTEPPTVHVLAGGFPCPAVSQAARGRNVAEWLWPEFARVIREVRPSYVVLENVEGLLSRDRGFGEVLGDLAESGFDAVWRVLRASDFGAPHHRPRVWLVGYTYRDGKPDVSLDDEVAGMPELRDHVREWADPPQGLGMDDGIPARMDRVRALGNAVVPHVAEWIGCRIIARERLVAA